MDRHDASVPRTKWDFVKKIWENPTDATVRLVFVDWLINNRNYRAANRQKIYAQLILNAVKIVYNKRINYILGVSKTAKGAVISWRMKRNGELVMDKKRANRFGLHHPLTGQWVTVYGGYHQLK